MKADIKSEKKRAHVPTYISQSRFPSDSRQINWTLNENENRCQCEWNRWVSFQFPLQYVNIGDNSKTKHYRTRLLKGTLGHFAFSMQIFLSITFPFRRKEKWIKIFGEVSSIKWLLSLIENHILYVEHRKINEINKLFILLLSKEQLWIAISNVIRLFDKT